MKAKIEDNKIENNKIILRLQNTFKELTAATKEIGTLITTVDLKGLTKDQQLGYGVKVESLKSLNMSFYTLCNIVIEDLGIKLEEIAPEINDYYLLQGRAKTTRLPEDDVDILKFKEYLKNN